MAEPGKVPAYKPLPPLGSDERQKMVDNLKEAFGNKGVTVGSADHIQVYDLLSQLNYQDRITLCHQVFRQQEDKDFIVYVDYFKDPELAIRCRLQDWLTITDGKPTYAGMNQFFYLMSDAPQDAHSEFLLNFNIYRARMNYEFSPTDHPKNVAVFKAYNLDVREFKSTNKANPNALYSPTGGFHNAQLIYDAKSFGGKPERLMELMGITLGDPPLRENQPLAWVDPPQYVKLPKKKTAERKELVETLVAAMGKPDSFEPGNKMRAPELDPNNFKGFADPDKVFQILAQFDFNERMALYRDALLAQGKPELVAQGDHAINQSLFLHFMYTGDGKKSFAGLENYFKLMADMPANYDNHDMLMYTIKVTKLSIDTDDSVKKYVKLYRPFDDKKEPSVMDKYRKFFATGGVNKDALPWDGYNHLELIGIAVGKPPKAKMPSTPAPTPAPCPAPEHPFRLDSQSEQGVLAEPRGLAGWAIPMDPHSRVMILPKRYTDCLDGLMPTIRI